MQLGPWFGWPETHRLVSISYILSRHFLQKAYFFEIGSQVTQAGFERSVGSRMTLDFLISPSTSCVLTLQHMPPCLVIAMLLGTEPKNACMLGKTSAA